VIDGKTLRILKQGKDMCTDRLSWQLPRGWQSEVRKANEKKSRVQGTFAVRIDLRNIWKTILHKELVERNHSALAECGSKTH
jgi:hypothetical protein